MKIVMLGNTGVGKTTYMASLYGMMQQRIKGFSLKAVNSSDHTGLLELAKTISHGRYPFATDQRSEYDFTLQYQGKEILQFCWSDYRGGAIVESQTSTQAQALVQDLQGADGIMMFCDGQALTQGNVRASEIRRMTTLVTQALQTVEHPISLAIVLTKTDLISTFQPELFNDFKGLMSVINASEWVSGSFIPIACGTQFINVPMPLLFALYAAAYTRAIHFAQLTEVHHNQAQEWQQRSEGFVGFLRSVRDTWNGTPTDTQMAQQALALAAESYGAFESIRDPVNSLIEYIREFPIIDDSKSPQNYAQACTQLKFCQQLSQTVQSSTFNPFEAFH